MDSKKLGKELAIFFAYSILYVFIVAVFSVGIRHFPMPILGAEKFTEDVWYVVFIKIIFLLFVPLFIYRKLGYKISSIFRIDFNWKNCIAVASCILVGMLVNSGYLAEISRAIVDGGPTTWLKFMVGLVIPLVQAAIPEEIFYRYILQTRLEKAFGKLLGILFSSLLFASFHFPSRYLLASGVEGSAGDIYSILMGTMLPVFVIGIILGYLWNRFRNIWVLIALHYGIDMLPSIASFLHLAK